MIRDCAPPLLRRTRRTSPGQRWVKLRRKSTRARQPALSLLVLRELTHFAAAWLRKRFEQPRSAEARAKRCAQAGNAPASSTHVWDEPAELVDTQIAAQAAACGTSKMSGASPTSAWRAPAFVSASGTLPERYGDNVRPRPGPGSPVCASSPGP